MAGVMNKSQISISLSSFLLIFPKTHLFTEGSGACLHGYLMAVSICPTLGVVNNPMGDIARNCPLNVKDQSPFGSQKTQESEKRVWALPFSVIPLIDNPPSFIYSAAVFCQMGTL